MQEIRQLFHEIANKLQLATTGAGLILCLSRTKDPAAKSQEEKDKEQKTLLQTASSIEQNAVEAGNLLKKLRKIVYEKIGIDPSKPMERLS